MATSEAEGLLTHGTATRVQRAVPRVQPTQDLDARIMAVQPARIIDISSRGAQIEVVASLQPSGPCDLRIQFDDGGFAVHAIVRHCRVSGFGLDGNNQQVVLYRAGLEFDEVDPECLARLSSHVLFPSGS